MFSNGEVGAGSFAGEGAGGLGGKKAAATELGSDATCGTGKISGLPADVLQSSGQQAQLIILLFFNSLVITLVLDE
jgi:hypothetical protein